jgi:hypothetical protein
LVIPRISARLDELLDDVLRCGDIGITHPQIHDVFSPATCDLFEFINDGEHIRGKATNTMKILRLLGDQAIPP